MILKFFNKEYQNVLKISWCKHDSIKHLNFIKNFIYYSINSVYSKRLTTTIVLSFIFYYLIENIFANMTL